MSDIVDRLRDKDAVVLSGLFHAVPTMREAADEIERLRTVLAFYADANNYASGDTHVRGMTRPVMQDYGRKAIIALSGTPVGGAPHD